MTAQHPRGRPPGTTKREHELIAKRLLSEQGLDETTVEQIASAAGISGRTLF
ncbi:helix-turn-helix domain-containing protein, partial [Nocardia carnea]|uniref:helix-turn-helix domain-containing protein n=1 Tax=Nocardia carnea TaxID=37328 RepID=UPI00245497E0